jgi:hypothetical protein
MAGQDVKCAGTNRACGAQNTNLLTHHAILFLKPGPVNIKDASANAVIGAQGKARRAALQSLAGGLPRLRFAPCSRPFEEQRIWHL